MSSKNSFFETIDRALLSLEERPQFGIPPFPLEALEKALQKRFQLKNLSISFEEKGWAKEAVDQEILTFYASSIHSPFYWKMSSKDQSSLFELFFSAKEDASYFFEKPLAAGLYQFIAVTVLKEVDHLNFIDVTFNLGESPKHIESQNCYRVDVSLKANNRVIAGTLLFPEKFRAEWKKHFAKNYKFFLKEELKRELFFDVGVEIGYCQVELDELKKAHLGDCILLDHSSYDTEKKEGSVVLTLNGEAIFRGKLKKEGIKLLEFPRLEEAGKIMDTEDNFEEETQGLDLSKGLGEEKNITGIEKLPLQVSVELGRLRMTLEELSNLAPGSLLELPINIEEGVNLVVNGKQIGKGDLLKIGEAFGVRITKI